MGETPKTWNKLLNEALFKGAQPQKEGADTLMIPRINL